MSNLYDSSTNYFWLTKESNFDWFIVSVKQRLLDCPFTQISLFMYKGFANSSISIFSNVYSNYFQVLPRNIKVYYWPSLLIVSIQNRNIYILNDYILFLYFYFNEKFKDRNEVNVLEYVKINNILKILVSN